MDEIGKEAGALEAQIAELRGRVAGADSIRANLTSAESLLQRLRQRLDEPLSWDQKRRLVEVLVAGVRIDTFEEWGVRQTNTTVTYRFSQPDQPTPIVLPQLYRSDATRIPANPQTIGDHLRKRRLELKMLQREVASQIGVDTTSVFNWEANKARPEIRFILQSSRFWATIRCRRLSHWARNWFASEPVWGCHKGGQPAICTSTPVHWPDGSVARGSHGRMAEPCRTLSGPGNLAGYTQTRRTIFG
jgi:DNA-binding XRE family transcriptional regulator